MSFACSISSKLCVFFVNVEKGRKKKSERLGVCTLVGKGERYSQREVSRGKVDKSKKSKIKGQKG